MSQLPDWARWVAFAGGATLVAGTWLSVIGTLIVPRPISSRISKLTGVTSIAVFSVFARRARSYRSRDRILAWQAPMSLFGRLVVWVAMFESGTR